MTIARSTGMVKRFDKGETFAGVPYDLALEAVDEIRRLVPDHATMAQFALRWILMEEAVTVVIPGAKTAEQAKANAAAGDTRPSTQPESGGQSCTKLQ